MFSLLPVYHKAESLDKGFSAWYKMLSNTVVQYLVSRADLKEMASTIKQNNTHRQRKVEGKYRKGFKFDAQLLSQICFSIELIFIRTGYQR